MFETLILHKAAPSAAGLLMEFVLCGIIVIMSGSRLSRYGDVIGDKTGMGNVLVGIILLSLITSLPELVASFGSVVVVKEPDLALGNLFGSNLFNLMILVILDFVIGKEALLSRIKPGQIIVGSYGIVASITAVFGIMLVIVSRPLGVSISWVVSIFILFIYINGIRRITKYEMENRDNSPELTDNVFQGISLRRAISFFIFHAVVILASGIWLVRLGDSLAKFSFQVGSTSITLGESFVGTIFIALVTSFPELIVSLSSVRIGAYSMAVGNVLGSNLCNMTFIPLIDLYYIPKMRFSVLASAAPQHILSACISIVLTGFVLAGLKYRTKRTFLRLSMDTWMIALLYFLGVYILFCVR